MDAGPPLVLPFMAAVRQGLWPPGRRVGQSYDIRNSGEQASRTPETLRMGRSSFSPVARILCGVLRTKRATAPGKALGDRKGQRLSKSAGGRSDIANGIQSSLWARPGTR